MIPLFQIKFAKFVLGVHKSATNIAVLSELGLFPLSLCTIKATINYWLHLLSAHANSLIYHSYQENALLKDGLCSKIKLLLAEIGFTHVWVNQCTFSKSKLLHSLSIKLLTIGNNYCLMMIIKMVVINCELIGN
jgi:hypothetical protein